ncbi:sulfite exporter TauE/SafE family protein [Alphaproteobacteria bacterium]|nr:sulfite exporter TauE/SafE family protein [Alphaproteobacteria bacterium]|tara:strand:- start:441 stop:1196 length:756 start_codon:yes stop_codon:yes gene_type:complete
MNFFINIFEIDIIIIIFMSVFLGAIIKGAVGIGMSMFSVPIIAFFLPPTTAMILLCVPVLITNILQMQIKKGISSFRFFPMFIALILGIIIGCNLILEINLSMISQIIAISIIFAAIINLFGINIKYINPNLERKLTIPLGFFSGIIGGLSSMYSPYILAYLVSTNLEKEALIRTMATMYFIGSIFIFPIWIYNGLGTLSDLIWSGLLLFPAILGQKIGTSIRSRISNESFKKIILYTLMIIGTSLLIKNI